MAYYLTTDTELTTVADAIRAKGGTSAALTYPSGFLSAIAAISTGITPTGTISITSNGTYDVTNYASATVNVSSGGGATWTEQLSGSVNLRDGFSLSDYITSADTVWCATFYDVHGTDANGDALAMVSACNESQTFEVYGKGDFSNYGGEGGAALLVDDVNVMLWVLDFSGNSGLPYIYPVLADNGGSPLTITEGYVTSFKTLG